MQKTLVTLAMILFAFAGRVTFGQDNRQIVLDAAKAIELGTATQEANQKKQAALKWLIETDQVSLIVCGQVFELFGDKKNKNSSTMTMAYTIGMGAFKVSYPDRAKDENAAQLAGLTLALKAYELAVAETPKTKFDKVDALLKTRDAGGLPALVTGFDCGKK